MMINIRNMIISEEEERRYWVSRGTYKLFQLSIVTWQINQNPSGLKQWPADFILQFYGLGIQAGLDWMILLFHVALSPRLASRVQDGFFICLTSWWGWLEGWVPLDCWLECLHVASSPQWPQVFRLLTYLVVLRAVSRIVPESKADAAWSLLV